METTMNNASPGQIRQGMSKAKRCFLLFTSQQDITREACRLLQVVKVVLVVFLPQQGILLTILAILFLPLRSTFQHTLDEGGRKTFFALGHGFGRARGEHLSSALASLRSHIDDVIGEFDHVEVVLDDEHGVAPVHQLL